MLSSAILEIMPVITKILSQLKKVRIIGSLEGIFKKKA